MHSLKKILVPVDFSERCAGAVRHARELALRFDSELILLHVLPPLHSEFCSLQIAGSMLVFIPAVGEFVIPSLLGGPNNLMIGRVLWDEFFGNHDWPVASAVAIAFLVLLVGPMALYQYYSARELEA